MVLIPATARALDRTVGGMFPQTWLRPDASRGLSRHLAGGTHIVSEGVFRSVLFRECRRADRANGGFMLLLLTIEGGAAPVRWHQAIAALSASRRETDVVGWFEKDRTIGAILPEAGTSDAAAAAQTIERRLRIELAKQ